MSFFGMASNSLLNLRFKTDKMILKKLKLVLAFMAGLIFSVNAQTVCQEQLVIDNGSSGFVHGQSVTMTECAGTFHSIELDRRDAGAEINNATLNIYRGEDLTATPIYVQTGVTIPAGSGEFELVFDESFGHIDFFEGEQYTFLINNTPGGYQLKIAGGNLYSGGQMYLNSAFASTFDWWFKLNINPLNADVCQEQLIIDNGASGTPLGQSFTMDECNGTWNSIDLHRRDAGNAIPNAEVKIFKGEDLTAEPIYLQEGFTIPAGVGKFRINFEGGKGSLNFTEGEQYTILIDNTPGWQLFIGGNNPYAGGQMYINTAFASTYDWWFRIHTNNSVICQEQLVIDNGSSGFVHGQSVTMTECSGHFNSIDMDRRDAGAAITDAKMSIYKGEDLTASPVYTQSGVTIPAGAGQFTVPFAGGTGSLAFSAGEQYTFIFDNTPGGYQLKIAGGNLYSGGQMYLNSAFASTFDWWFKLNILSDASSDDAKDHVPVAVTGFNQDVIAEGTGGDADAVTTTTFDNPGTEGSNHVLYTKEFRNDASKETYGLPNDGKINSKDNALINYQLADYDGNNVLLLTGSETGDLTLGTPGVYSRFTILSSSAQGSSTFKVIVTYSDETTEEVDFSVPDWAVGEGASIDNLGRIERDGDTYQDIDIKMYDNTVNVNPAKIVTKLSFAKGGGSGRTGIFAICGLTPLGVPDAPEATAATDVVKSTSFVANWEEVDDATGYVIDVATDAEFTNLLAAYNNGDVGNVTTTTVNTTEALVYYRVRAYNAQGQSLSSNVVTVDLAQSVGGTLMGGLDLYPNPGNGLVTINSANGNVESLVVRNISGQTVSVANNLGSNGTIDLSNLKPGVYLMEVKAGGKVGMMRYMKF